METAHAYWDLSDLIGEVVARVLATGKPVSEVVDDMAAGETMRLSPEDDWLVRRTGLVTLANDRGGMRGVRSGKIQSAGVSRRPIPEEEAGLEEWADQILARLVFEGADGIMKPVTDFTHADAENAYRERVVGIRERADREEPFWLAVLDATPDGWTVRRRSASVRRKLAQLAVQAKLTKNGDDAG